MNCSQLSGFKDVPGWTIVFALLAVTGAGVSLFGAGGPTAMKAASVFFSILCLISLGSRAMGNRPR